MFWCRSPHGDVVQWKHFPRHWPFVWGIHRSPVKSPHKCQWRGDLMFCLICALNKRMRKQSWDWWFETPSRSLWRHCNDIHFGGSCIYTGRGRAVLPLGTVLPMWQRYCRRISAVLPLVNTLESINLPDTPRRSIPVERWISIDRSIIVCM